MRIPAFWALIGAGLVPSLVLTGLSFNQVAILTDRGLPATLAAATFTVESLVGLPITFMAGSLADRFPLRFTLAAGQAFLALAMVAVCLLSMNINIPVGRSPRPGGNDQSTMFMRETWPAS